MREFLKHSDNRDDALVAHITEIEKRVIDSEKNYEVLAKTNTTMLGYLRQSVDHLSTVNEKLTDTLNEMDKKFADTRNHAEVTDSRLNVVEDDVKALKGGVSDVRKELRAVDDKSKIDVTESWREQAKKNILPIAGGATLITLAITLFEYLTKLA